MDNNLICITEHAYLRMKQRNGWNRKTADRMVSRVYNNGLRPEQVKGYLKNWVMKKADNVTDETDFVIFGQSLYIFIENRMITVLHIPSKSSVLENMC